MKNYAPAARDARAYFRTALSMPGAAFFKSSRFIAGCNSTFALKAKNQGSAMAGICDEFSTVRYETVYLLARCHSSAWDFAGWPEKDGKYPRRL